VQADGKIVLAGSTGVDMGVARLSSGGVLDPTFGTSGTLSIDAGGTADTAKAITLQSDGKIVITGGNGTQMVTFRLNSVDGSRDTTFGTNGRVGVGVTGTGDIANALTIQSDGSIILAGGTGSQAIAVVRLSMTGVLDSTFGTSGIATFNVGGSDSANAVALNSAGQILVGGTAGSDGVLLRLLAQASSVSTLVVTGPAAGQALLYTANPATGRYTTTASATIGPVAGLGLVPLRSASADVDGDGIPDTILVTGPGTPIRVTVISGADNTTVLVQPFDPFGGNFTGGGYVAAADLDGDGKAEFAVTPDQGGGPRVSIFSLGTGGAATPRANFFGINDPNFRGGARAAFGDVNGDGTPDLAVAAGFGGGPRVSIYNGHSVLGTPSRLVGDFFAFPGTDAVNLRNGAFLAVGDVDGDGKADMIFGGGPGGAPRVFIISGAMLVAGNTAGAQAAPIANFFVAGNTADRGGARVAAVNPDGGNKSAVAVGSGAGDPARVRIYPGSDFPAGGGEPGTFQDLNPGGGAVLVDGVYVS
ncbi:MAG TPA: FG-GAP-like repeat-containing protein, partial [Urbifossiella sp.]|nr:FG-GAP-like repeat-containing protein [Urbifossiella sp.]